MLQVMIDETYAAILEPLQEVADTRHPVADITRSVEAAIHYYALEKAKSRLLALEQKAQHWGDKYQCGYDLFVYRTAIDEAYVAELDASPATQQWEGDLISWEFDYEELTDEPNSTNDLGVSSGITVVAQDFTQSI